MAKVATKDRTESQIQRVNPSFLAQYVETDTSLEGMDQYRILPRLKIIQGMTDKALKDVFGEGAAIIRPGDACVLSPQEVREGKRFLFVPQFFWAEAAKWADLKDKEGPSVIARSFDPTSELFKRADDPDKRFEIYPGYENKRPEDQRRYRYVHHLRFAGVIYGDHGLAGTPVVLSFERGEFMQGKNFISAIKMRRQKITVGEGEFAEEKSVPVPLWAQVWSFTIGWRPRAEGGGWYGFDFQPAEPPLISEKDHEEMYKAHVELKELHEKDRLRVDDDDSGREDPAEVRGVDPTKSQF